MNLLDTAPGELAAEVFEKIRGLVHRKSGIALGDGKETLVRARLGKRMRALGITDYREYLSRVEDDPTGEELVHLLDVVSTNVTSFYREADHFQILADEVRRRTAVGQKRLRLWSAACSTGEEPYTMAMTCLGSAGAETELKILATDLSTQVLERARAGFYEASKVEPIPPALLERSFEREAGGYRVRPSVRNAVSFARLNLMEIPYPMSGPFDAVFCRNVMIYFDAAGRRRVVGEIVRLLRPGGLLFVGHAESLSGWSTGLKVVGPSAYAKS